MLKNKKLLWVILPIFLLVFSMNGFTAYYCYTQQSGANFYVSGADKSDALEDTNELRQIVDDLGNLLVHSKRNDLYPKDGTTGGTLQIPEAGLKFSNAPVNNDIAAYIAGEMAWQTKAELGLDLSLYYLKTAIDTQGEMETIWGVTLATDTELAALTYSDVGAIQDAINTIDSDKYVDGSIDHEHLAPDVITGLTEVTSTDLDMMIIADQSDSWALKKVDMGEVRGAGGGYTNLTSFIDQTAWRVFYSDSLGDVIELALGADGTYLRSNGAAAAPTFGTPSGAGDMLKATYDIDEDGDIDVAAGGTEKSSWTQYCIPYLSGTTAFGEIAIGTASYALTVNGTTDGYTFIDVWTEAENTAAGYIANTVDDTTPQLGGDLDMNEKNLIMDSTLTSDHNWSGITEVWPVGETVVFGDLLYFNFTDKEWKKIDADAAATMPGLRIALEGKADGQDCKLLIKGFIRDDTWDFTASMVYASCTAGGVTSTAPSASGDQVQRVGVAVHADKMFFDPSIDVGEI